MPVVIGWASLQFKADPLVGIDAREAQFQFLPGLLVSEGCVGETLKPAHLLALGYPQTHANILNWRQVSALVVRLRGPVQQMEHPAISILGQIGDQAAWC